MPIIPELYADALIGEGLEVEVAFDYEPARLPTYGPPEVADPGNAEEIIINQVLADGRDTSGKPIKVDIMDDLNEACLDRLVDRCRQFIPDSDRRW